LANSGTDFLGSASSARLGCPVLLFCVGVQHEHLSVEPRPQPGTTRRGAKHSLDHGSNNSR
jgi:hypothetical protein